MTISRTLATKWQPVFSAVSTSSTWESLNATSTRPTAGVINTSSNVVHNHIQIQMIGTDAANETIESRIIGWEQDSDNIWQPTLLAEADWTLGAATDTNVNTNAKIADTVTLTGPESAYTQSPENDLVAHVIIDITGLPLIQIDTNVGTAAAAYPIYRLL